MKTNLPITGRERTFDKRARIISTTNAKGVITSFNKDFQEISGFTDEELLKKSHNIVRHPDMPPAAFADLWKAIKSKRPWMGIVKNRCKNGDHYWVNAYVTPIIENGQVIECQSVRTKPSAEQVQRAERVYKRLKENKKPFLPGLSFVHKLYASIIVTLSPVLATQFIWPDLIIPAILFSTVLGVGLIHWLTRPFVKLAEESKTLRGDDPLMRYIYTNRTDEIGQLQLANQMSFTELDAVVSRINFSCEHLTNNAVLSSSMASQSSKGIREQQQAVREMAESITRMSTSIEEVTTFARNAAHSTRQADTEANNGKEKVSDTITAINATAEEISNASSVIRQLEGESQAIGGVLDVIRNIAEQTNLLALNAAIEAARAGSQGRGFAVVADEVRTLAQRTQDSIAEIEAMIHRVQDTTEVATKVMEQSCNMALEGSRRSVEASDFLDVITQDISDITARAGHIANLSEEQTHSVNSIKNNIEHLRQSSEQAVNLAIDSEDVSKQMTDHVVQVKKLVHQFQR